MSRQKRAETPLAHVIDDLRREPLPSVDWESVEDELMVKAGAPARHPAKRAGGVWMRWSFALAASVLGAGVFLLARPPASDAPPAVSAPAPVVQAAQSPVDGRALAAGAVVSAGSSPVVVNHQGHVTWTLDQGSTARVESAGEIVALALEGGAVSARVVKSQRPETFVVRVENTRVAVHGTEFRVERVASGVHVTVNEGVLGIGPVGGPSFELLAPGSATLDLHGLRTDQQQRAAVAPPVRHIAEHPRAPVAANADKAAPTAPQAPLAEQPAPAAAVPRQPEGSGPVVELASRAVQKCFGAHALVRGDLHVSVMMKMALRVTNDGTVGDALFEPPLAPGVRECVDREIGALRFPESPEGFMATRRLELTY